MTNILVINSAATGDASVSTRLTADFAARLQQRNTAARIVVRDVGAAPIPHLTAETLGAVRGEPQGEEALRARALSDELIAEVKEADLIVIGAPMYNFGIPSTLKAWFDHVLRAGVSFRYTANGPEGLVGNKPVVVIETRGGLYSEGPSAALDAQEPHLRTMLGFIGLKDVTFVRAERLGMGPDAVAAAVDGALERLDTFAAESFALAA